MLGGCFTATHGFCEPVDQHINSSEIVYTDAFIKKNYDRILSEALAHPKNANGTPSVEMVEFTKIQKIVFDKANKATQNTKGDNVK